jgi:hypothetical protein
VWGVGCGLRPWAFAFDKSSRRGLNGCREGNLFHLWWWKFFHRDWLPRMARNEKLSGMSLARFKDYWLGTKDTFFWPQQR